MLNPGLYMGFFPVQEEKVQIFKVYLGHGYVSFRYRSQDQLEIA